MSILGYESVEYGVVPSETRLILNELVETNKKLDVILSGKVSDNSNKLYYLWDKFYSTNDDCEFYYLNYYPENGRFRLSSKEENGVYKTKFTDSNIEYLNIPIERFVKIEVGELDE